MLRHISYHYSTRYFIRVLIFKTLFFNHIVKNIFPVIASSFNNFITFFIYNYSLQGENCSLIMTYIVFFIFLNLKTLKYKIYLWRIGFIYLLQITIYSIN